MRYWVQVDETAIHTIKPKMQGYTGAKYFYRIFGLNNIPTACSNNDAMQSCKC